MSGCPAAPGRGFRIQIPIIIFLWILYPRASRFDPQSFHASRSRVTSLPGLRGWVIFLVLVIFLVNYPAGLTPLRFGLSMTGLLILPGINLTGINLLPPRQNGRPNPEGLAFPDLFSAAHFRSDQPEWPVRSRVHLVSGLYPGRRKPKNIPAGGVLFSIATLLGWFCLQVVFQSPINAIVGREFAPVVGVVFGFVVVFLIQRTVHQTEQAEALLSELQAANRELELARQKDKELAVAEERLRLARDLHDSVSQLLYSLSLYAGAAAELLNSGSPEMAAGHISELQDTTQLALREMRLLIFELRPPALAQGGLAAALQARLDTVEAHGGIKTCLQVEGEENLSTSTQAELYSIAMEALNNVLKHAHAQSVRIRLEFGRDLTKLEIHDNGKGFESGRAAAGRVWHYRHERAGWQDWRSVSPSEFQGQWYKCPHSSPNRTKRNRRLTMSAPIRVLIADDHAIVRKGIRALLATKHDLQVVGEAGNGSEAVSQAQSLHPDVVLMDLMMPGKDGIQATREISSLLPETRVLVLTSFTADEQVFPAIKAARWDTCSRIRDPSSWSRLFAKSIAASRAWILLLPVRSWPSCQVRRRNRSLPPC